MAYSAGYVTATLFNAYFTVVQEMAPTAIAAQAHNSKFANFVGPRFYKKHFGGCTMSDEFDQPGGDREGRGWESVLNLCRVLAAKIANELRNKRPEHFADKLSLADLHASLERAADVLSTVKGSQGRHR